MEINPEVSLKEIFKTFTPKLLKIEETKNTRSLRNPLNLSTLFTHRVIERDASHHEDQK